MTIYQVINKQNKMEYAYVNYEAALNQVKKLGEALEDDFYRINEVEDEDLQFAV